MADLRTTDDIELLEILLKNVSNAFVANEITNNPNIKFKHFASLFKSAFDFYDYKASYKDALLRNKNITKIQRYVLGFDYFWEHPLSEEELVDFFEILEDNFDDLFNDTDDRNSYLYDMFDFIERHKWLTTSFGKNLITTLKSKWSIEVDDWDDADFCEELGMLEEEE